DLDPAHVDSMLRTAYLTKLELERIPGDFDGNGAVDHGDLSYWQAAFGLDHGGDADGDGDSDGADFLIWQRNAGRPAPHLLNVPEPNLAVVASGFLLLFLVVRPKVSPRFNPKFAEVSRVSEAMAGAS